MLFTEYDLIGYLLTNCPDGNGKPFLSYADFKDNKVNTFQDKKKYFRNNIFRVKKSVDPQEGIFFLKQPKRIEQEFKQTIFTEANIYKYIPEQIKVYFPNIIGFDKTHFLLICKHIDSKPFNFIDKTKTNMLARGIKLIHEVFEAELIKDKQRERYEDYIPTSKPFVFRLDKQTVKGLSDGIVLIDNKQVQLEAINWLKNIKNLNQLSQISTKWIEKTIIHQDLKANNILVTDGSLKFVDWEMAIIGDNYWDLASVLFEMFSGINELKSENFSQDCKSIFEKGAIRFADEIAPIYFESNIDYAVKLTEFTGVYILQKNVIGRTDTLKFAFEILNDVDTYAAFFKKKI